MWLWQASPNGTQVCSIYVHTSQIPTVTLGFFCNDIWGKCCIFSFILNYGTLETCVKSFMLSFSMFIMIMQDKRPSFISHYFLSPLTLLAYSDYQDICLTFPTPLGGKDCWAWGLFSFVGCCPWWCSWCCLATTETYFRSASDKECYWLWKVIQISLII